MGERRRDVPDLTHDGKGAVTGTVVVGRAGGKEETLPIGRGTFDAKTGALTLEGAGDTPDGKTGTYTIKGMVTGDVIRGSYAFAGTTGEFSFDRLNGAASQFDYLLGDWEFTWEDEVREASRLLERGGTGRGADPR